VKIYSESWGDLEIQESSVEKIMFEINAQIRFKSGVSNLYQYRTEIGSAFQFGGPNRIGVYFKNIQKKYGITWESINCGGMYGVIQFDDVGGVRLINKSRLEYWNLKEWKMRSLLKVAKIYVLYYARDRAYGASPLIYKLVPCLEEEIFFNINKPKIDENRLLMTIRFEISSVFAFKVGYMLHTKKEKGWHHKGVVVAGLELNFLEEE
jgi:hypothetical protein